jgi:hypothetical protein
VRGSVPNKGAVEARRAFEPTGRLLSEHVQRLYASIADSRVARDPET